MKKDDGSIVCDWDGQDVDPEDWVVLDLDMPKCTTAYIHIKNDLCSDCTRKVLATLGETELEIKKTINQFSS